MLFVWLLKIKVCCNPLSGENHSILILHLRYDFFHLLNLIRARSLEKILCFSSLSFPLNSFSGARDDDCFGCFDSDCRRALVLGKEKNSQRVESSAEGKKMRVERRWKGRAHIAHSIREGKLRDDDVFFYLLFLMLLMLR